MGHAGDPRDIEAQRRLSGVLRAVMALHSDVEAPGIGLGYSRSDECVGVKESRDCWRLRSPQVTSSRGEAPGRG